MAKGSIVSKRGNPDSLYVVIDDEPVNGKRRQSWTTVKRVPGQTDKQFREAAERKLRELLTARDRGESLASDRLTVAEVFKRWEEAHFTSKGLSTRTVNGYKSIFRTHVEPAIGTKTLKELKPADVQALYAGMYAKGRSGTTVLHVHRVLSEALKWAVRSELAQRNVCDRVDAPKAVRRDLRIASDDDLARVIDAADRTPIATLVRLTIWTGLRLGEALGLRWIDIAGNRLSVAQALGTDNEFRVPKTKLSRRTITLAPELVAILDEHRKAQRERYLADGIRPELDLVFTNEIGKPFTQNAAEKHWRDVRKSAGVPDLRFHDLRHAHASHLLAANVPVVDVQVRLGHARASTTLDFYAHSLPGGDEAAAAVMSRVLNGSNGRASPAL
jgi:integrase